VDWDRCLASGGYNILRASALLKKCALLLAMMAANLCGNAQEKLTAASVRLDTYA